MTVVRGGPERPAAFGLKENEVIEMSVLNAVMVPHPPLIIPQVGRGEETKIQDTIDAYRKAAVFIKEADPDTVLILTPHNVMYYDYFHVSPGSGADGDFNMFRAPEVTLHIEYDEELQERISAFARENSFPAGTEGEKDPKLDHASLIPLLFLKEAYGEKPLPKAVRLSLSGRLLTEHYYWGMMLRDAADSLDRRISIIASGDLSHKLLESGPYGFHEAGPEYDRKIMDVMSSADFGKLFQFSDAFCESAAECGHRSFTIMAGCFDRQKVRAEKLSYEGPFGVGYGVCLFTPGEEDDSRSFLDQEIREEAQKHLEARENEDAYARLARTSVETWVYADRPAKVPADLPEEMLSEKAGVFVSIHMNGRLRGCIGTISPAADCIAQEIINNGISACSRDPRFGKVTKEELPYLEYSVDVLGEAEPVSSMEDLDPQEYGVIVSRGERRGLLLPALDGVDSVEKQLEIARKKAGIREDEPYTIERFRAYRHV